jgi:hypothetical protein
LDRIAIHVTPSSLAASARASITNFSLGGRSIFQTAVIIAMLTTEPP